MYVRKQISEQKAEREVLKSQLKREDNEKLLLEAELQNEIKKLKSLEETNNQHE